MFARIRAVCGWLAWLAQRPFGPLGRGRHAWMPPTLLAAMLLVAAAVPIVLPLFDPQPQDVTVQELFDDAVTEPNGWVRLTGRLVPLQESPTGRRGRYALLVDETNPLRAVVVEVDARPEVAERVELTGTVTDAGAIVEEELPIEATVAGTPPRVVPDHTVVLDEVQTPPRESLWFLAVPPALLALVLLAGARSGYPIFEPTTEVSTLTSPLAAGERVPTAYGGRIGTNERTLTEPGGALLLVRGGPSGNLLTAQPLADDGGLAPPPVLIGGAWTTGRVGVLHTVSESVPALVVRSELVDATFLFAKSSERDRVAALVAVER
jgi:hypothetical protein